jgi:transmembrane sensor
MEKKDITLLIKKYLAGKCTPEEALRLEQWWEAALDDDRSMDALSREEQDAIQGQMLININLMIRQQEMQSGHQEKPAAPRGTIRTLISWKYTMLAVACSLLLIIASTIFLQVVKTGASTHVTSAYGERRTVTLPDGSTVVLNGNSSLDYSGWEKDQDRKVWLTGEAFFSVKHTVNHKRFIVYTPDSLKIEVLGTQFSVNNRRGITDVVLQEGKVKLMDARAFYIMKPDEMVRYSKDKQEFITKTVNAQQKIAWKDNLLIYRDESIGSIVEKLTESHGLKVVFENETIKEEIFNGSVPADSVSLFFDKINKLYNANVTQESDGSYIIR